MGKKKNPFAVEKDKPVQPAVLLAESDPPSLPVEPVFYSRRDKQAFWIAAGVTFLAYMYTLAPSVTLEDSGEFLAAANSLGVPHPPGYPSWTIFAWLFKTLIPFGNVAWRVNLMSAFFGAWAVGLAALLISKAGHVMGHHVGVLQKIGDEKAVDWLVLASAVSGALMLAFTPVMWSQSVITEVYSLNAFFLLATLALLYRWSFEPERLGILYAAAFVWGVSLTNHQTLVLLVWAFPLYVWMVDRQVGRDTAIPIALVSVVMLFKMNMSVQDRMLEILRAMPGMPSNIGVVDAMRHMFDEPVRAQLFPLFVQSFLIIALGVWLYYLFTQGPGLFGKIKAALVQYAMVILGLCFYLYMPVASATNPPMNWGYTRTMDGFIHHFTRGQYERIRTDRLLERWWEQLAMFLGDVMQQFNWVYALVALAPFVFLWRVDGRSRRWLAFLAFSYGCLSLGFLFLSNPVIEKQKQFTDRVFFLPGHCIWALLIGFGLILGVGYLVAKLPQLRQGMMGIVAVIFLMPVVSFALNWSENEQRGHDFGYKFGYLMFKPGGGYPDMDRGSVLYGGTDPGRFVPTHMIMVESQVSPRSKTRMEKYPESGTFDRRDVYIITQNALADGTYMNYLRDHYWPSRPRPEDPSTLENWPVWQRLVFRAAWSLLGRKNAYPEKPIWLPDGTALSQAFDEFVRARKARGEGGYTVQGMRVSVQGVIEVMEVNGILARMIFDKNKEDHSFYVEESYVIPWMYPHLEPYGIIMKINKEPLPAITDEMVERDRRYWNALYEELVHDPKFQRDDVAQKSFSKLRAAIGGLYMFRERWEDAEYAFRQAVDLGPDSPEANFRLSQLYCRMDRYDEGLAVMQKYQLKDPQNEKIQNAINTIHQMREQHHRLMELKTKRREKPDDIQTGLRLLEGYAALQQHVETDTLTKELIGLETLDADGFWGILQVYARTQRLDKLSALLDLFVDRYPKDSRGWRETARMRLGNNDLSGSIAALRRYLDLEPRDPLGWYQLGLLLSGQLMCEEAMVALEQAVRLDRRLIQNATQDPGWNVCRKHSRFLQIINPVSLR